MNSISRAKEYFEKFILELKSLPYEIKKRLLKKFIVVFILFIPLSNLVTDFSIKQEPVLKEVVAEVNQESIPVEIDKEVVDKKSKLYKILSTVWQYFIWSDAISHGSLGVL